MQKVLLLISIVGVSLLFSCKNNRIIGSGESVTATKKVRNFKSIIVDLPANITVNCTDSSVASCSISAQANTQNYIVCNVENDELILTTTKNTNVEFTKAITIQINTPSLEEIKVLGSSDVTVNGKPSGNTFVAAILGSGNIVVNNAHYKAIKAELSGSGNITYKNSTAIQANYDLKGSGNIDAKTTLVSDVQTVLTGSGNIHCNAYKTLDARLAGSGNITYIGKPSITKNVSGSGEIIAE